MIQPLKKVLFAILSILLSLNGFCQDTLPAHSIQLTRPWFNDFGFRYDFLDPDTISESNKERSFQDYSFSLGYMYHFQSKHSFHFRLRSSITSLDRRENIDYQMTDSIRIGWKNEAKNIQLTIAPGFYFSKSIHQFILIGGLELPIDLRGRYNLSSVSTVGVLTSGSDYSVTQIKQYNGNYPVSIGLGTGVILGLSYRVTDQISLGFEFAPALSYIIYLGESNLTTPDPYVGSIPVKSNLYNVYTRRYSLNLTWRSKSK